jgi:uncharacterized protein (TIGR03435 family)
VTAGSHVTAQEPILSPKLAFEVASVKVNTSRTCAPMQWQPGGRFVMGLPVFSLISIGYGVPDLRIVGMPDWVRTVFFDVDARADHEPTLDERRAYYRGLLEDRFKLAVHTELRELPAYALVLARADGRLGQGLRRSDVDCAPVIAANVARAQAGARPAPRLPGQRPMCGGVGGPASFTGGAVEISALTGLLASGLERPVIDKTGLTGRFDIDFRSAPMRTAGPAAAPATELPSVFTAVQEQLGLKLETTTAPVHVLVIDRIAMPTEN